MPDLPAADEELLRRAMRQIYAEKRSEKVTATHSKYVFSDRIEPGKVLHVKNCFAHAPERSLSDVIWMGIRNGGQDILVRARGGAIAKEGMSALRDFFVGEGDQVFAYFPDAADTHTIELHVIGVLMPLDEWRQMRE